MIASTPLTPDEESVLRQAAYGAVSLLSMARPGPLASTKQNMAGAIALASTTGVIGRILSQREKVVLRGTAAEVADQVFPLLSQAVNILEVKAPNYVGECRDVVLDAVREAAPTTGQPNTNQSRVIDQVSAALSGS